MSDFVYANAPLAEVIAEIFWETIPLTIIPGAAIDPFFSLVQPKFGLAMREADFVHAERVIPASVPLELLAGQVVERFRRSEGGYPLFQIGPGIVTCNNVPPYDGWPRFRQDVALGLDTLMRVWPETDGPRLRMLRLRYLDAFDDANGYREDLRFLHDDLHVGSGLPADIIADFCDQPADVAVGIVTRMPLRNLEGSVMSLAVNRGEKNGKAAYVLDTAVEWNISDPDTVKSWTDWFDDAHAQISSMFKRIVSADLERTFGEKMPKDGN